MSTVPEYLVQETTSKDTSIVSATEYVKQKAELIADSDCFLQH